MIELTDEMRDAVKGRMGIPRGDRLDPWMEAAIQDVLALVERDLRLRIEAEVTAERERIRQVVGLPFLAAIRCVPDGRIQSGCVVHDGKTVRERAKQAYLNALDPAGRP